MTARLAVPAGERGTVRVFAIDLPDAEARGFAADPASVGRALGEGALDLDHVAVFPVSRLAPLDLPAFLAEGHGVAAPDLAPHQAALASLDGHVAVVTSGAFRGAAKTLAVTPPLRLVGTFREERPPVVFGALPAGGAERAGPRPDAPRPRPAPERHRRRRTGLLPIAVLILAVLGFIVLNGAR